MGETVYNLEAKTGPYSSSSGTGHSTAGLKPLTFGYNADQTIFQGVTDNLEANLWYDTHHPGLNALVRKGDKAALKKHIAASTDFAAYQKSKNTGLPVIRSAKSGIEYVVSEGGKVYVISRGTKEYVMRSVEHNSLEAYVSGAVQSDNKDATCREMGIDVYVSNKAKDLTQTDGAVPYFVMVDATKAGKFQKSKKGTMVYYVSDLSRGSMREAYTKIQQHKWQKHMAKYQGNNSHYKGQHGHGQHGAHGQKQSKAPMKKAA